VCEISRWLFRYRGEIGGAVFLILYPYTNTGVGMNPFSLLTPGRMLLAGIFVLSGLLLRALARVYIGERSDSRLIVMEKIIDRGVYKLRHPMYLGNFFLTFGVLTAMNLPSSLFWITFSLFIGQYTLFILAEEKARRHARIDDENKVRWGKMVLETKTLVTLGIIYLLLLVK